jgi:tetratricopeptide (TPR) repeat protein
VVSTALYAWQTIWPVGLSPYYPLAPLGGGVVAIAGVVLVAGVAFAVRTRTSQPYLFTGFGWLLVTLAPVIGIIQVSLQAHADRYMYIPQIGLVLAVVWAIAELVGRRPALKTPAVVLAVVMLAMFAVLTWRQLGYWQNTFTLFEPALAVTDNNYLAHHSLGVAYKKAGRLEDAKTHYTEAIRIRPQYGEALTNLAEVLVAEGRFTEAVAHLERAVAATPNLPEARVNYGFVLNRIGRNQESIEQYRRAIQLRPRHGPSWMGLAQVLAETGQVDEAVRAAQAAIKFSPNDTALQAAATRLLRRLGR